MGGELPVAGGRLGLGAELLKAQLKEQVVSGKQGAVRLGRFELRCVLGRGGTGVVYEARDTVNDARVALKHLQDLDVRAVERLKREFRVLADVSHPNLVTLHELFEAQGEWFFTMELVSGVPFQRYARPLGGGESDVDEGRLRAALGQLVQAVSAIHAAGKLHCDLKSSNVLVTHVGRVVVLDYGLAREEEPDNSRLSARTLGGGTPAYVSPEQAAGKAATRASDWYSVGVMLYEALTGRLPFEGGPLQVLVAKRQQDAPAPCSVAPGTAADLNALCNALLLREPAARAGAAVASACITGLACVAPKNAAPVPDAVPELFVGRDVELSALRTAFAQADESDPVVVLVHGPSGIGKSVLLRRFVQELRQAAGALVLQGRCYERESVPYKVFDGLADQLARHLSRRSDAEVLALLPRNVGALVRVFREFSRVRAIQQQLGDAPERERRHQSREERNQAFAALRELLQRICDRRPLVLVVDDLQWGDLDSVRLLEHVLGPPDAPPLLFVGACRREELTGSAFLRELLPKTENRAFALSVQQVAVDALDAAQAQELTLSHPLIKRRTIRA